MVVVPRPGGSSMTVVDEHGRAAPGEARRGGPSGRSALQVVDADGHVIEPEAMFASLEEEFRPHRPLPVMLPPDTPSGDANGVWLIEGKALPNIGGVGGRPPLPRGRPPPPPQGPGPPGRPHRGGERGRPAGPGRVA